MDKREKIRNFVERACGVLDQVDYYRLLSISSAASSEQIQLAYYTLASSLHPDVHGVDVDVEYRGKLTEVFSRVVEAYKVLSDSVKRDRYDRELAAGHLRLRVGTEVKKSCLDISSPNAMKFYKLGIAALRSKDTSAAIMNFRFALQVEPDSESIKKGLNLAEEMK